MGYYIQTPHKFSKAEQLVLLHNGMDIPCPSSYDKIPTDKALICVVHNDLFEAAGFAYDEKEFERFKYGDDREKEWVLIDRAVAEQLTGFKR